MRCPVALTVAGTDSSGGAGVAADLKTFEAHGVWGACAVTAVTAQSTLGVSGVETISPSMVRQQIVAVGTDLTVAAVKTGMLGTAEVAAAVADALEAIGAPALVVDPVLVSSTGDRLLADDAVAVLRSRLLPLAAVVTPNLHEAGVLTGIAVVDRHTMVEAARDLAAQGPNVVMVTGGHLPRERVTDLVLVDGEPMWLDGPRIETSSTHGTGCVLSAAIAAELAKGMEPADACVAAKRFVERAIAAGIDLGGGADPVDPGWQREG